MLARKRSTVKPQQRRHKLQPAFARGIHAQLAYGKVAQHADGKLILVAQIPHSVECLILNELLADELAAL